MSDRDEKLSQAGRDPAELRREFAAEPPSWPYIVDAQVVRPGGTIVDEDGTTVLSGWMLRVELEHGTILVPLLGLLAAQAMHDPGLDKALDP